MYFSARTTTEGRISYGHGISAAQTCLNLEILVLLENTTVIEVCNIAERLAAESTTAARAAEHLAVK